jgi:hypothetical protein
VIQVTSRQDVSEIAKARSRHEDSGIHRVGQKVVTVLTAALLTLGIVVGVLRGEYQ